MDTDVYRGWRPRPILWALAALALIAIVLVAVFAIRWATAEPRGKIQAREQIQSAGSRIAAYNHFFDLCAAVQTDEAQLDALWQQLAATTDEGELARIRTSITGVLAARQRSIFQYNADARKDYTAGQFRDSDLPYQLPTKTYAQGGVRTSCESA